MQLVPRTNRPAPALDDAAASAAARSRLEVRLDLYGLCERQVPGDGNCQFAALADQIYSMPAAHGEVRRRVVCQLRQHRGWYESYVLTNYDSYCSEMAAPGTWGDHVTLQAAADAYGLRISLLTSYEEGCFIEIQPRQGSVPDGRVLWLSYWAEVHYNSVYPVAEPPPVQSSHDQTKSGKVLGSRRLHALLFS